MNELNHGTAQTIVLVGDRFAPFLAARLGVSPAEFAASVGKGEYDRISAPVYVQVGQGVDEQALTEAVAAIEARELTDRLLLYPEDLPVPVQPQSVHKRDARNVLVADFAQTDGDVFEAALRIHNDNELVDDHQSSLHIQGMVLIEAARQMFLGVCELHYMRHLAGRGYAYLLTDVSTKFARPAYPLPVQMRLTAHRAETDDAERVWFSVETRFLQAGREVAATTVDCAVRPLEHSVPFEVRTATAATAKLPRRARVAGVM